MQYETIEVTQKQSYKQIRKGIGHLTCLIVAALIVMNLRLGVNQVPKNSINAIIEEHGLNKMSLKQLRKYCQRMQEERGDA